jgi:hypothetical protein
MQVLFAISIVCLCALFWAAVSIARHILVTQRRRRRGPRPPAPLNEVLFEEKQQQIRDHSAIAAAQTLPRTVPSPVAPQPFAETPYRRYIPLTEIPLSPSNAISYTNKGRPAYTAPAAPIHPAVPVTAPQSIAEPQAAKKAPQPVLFSREHKRLDWDYFNKDLGDLSDPYQPPSASDSRNGTRRY